MAYPTVDAPYGLVPVNLIGGQPYAGSTRQMKIASSLMVMLSSVQRMVLSKKRQAQPQLLPQA
jgi:hypothetical protein